VTNKTAGAEKFEGVFAILTTSFNADWSIDEPGLRAHCDFLAAAPVDVIVALGTEGESYALTDAERRRVAEVVVDAVAGRKPVICGVSHSSTIESVALARHAKSAGADAVMSLAPYFVKAGVDGARRHFQAIAKVGIPLFLYNSPGRVGYGLSPEELDQIAAEAPGVVGIKQASPDLSELAALVSSSRIDHVIGGAETAFWPALSVGARGNTATAASALPEPFAAMWKAREAGDTARGEGVYASLEPLRRAYRMAGGQAQVVKRLQSMVGLPGGPVRPPLAEVSSAVEAVLRTLLDQLAFHGELRARA
jgi:4-hydroxy-tetrahydrodipicolinate synthase